MTAAQQGWMRATSEHLAEARALLDQAHTVPQTDGYADYLVARAQVFATMALAAAQAAWAAGR